MTDLITATILGCVIGFCIHKIFSKIPKPIDKDSGFWYTLTFLDKISDDTKHGFKNIIAMFDKQILTAENIAIARDKSGASKEATLISLTYLGYNSVNEFIGDVKETNE